MKTCAWCSAVIQQPVKDHGILYCSELCRQKLESMVEERGGDDEPE